jgi:ATP-dependent helicase/nuclease subunit B
MAEMTQLIDGAARPTTDLQLTAYGPPATHALADAVQRAKASPLDPVTVVVGSNFAGLAARRLLGGTVGVANVHFFTAFRLAELLSADLLLDRRPLTNPVLGAAVRRALAEQPGRYRHVVDHVATEKALSALYAELSNVSDASLSRLGASDDGIARSAVQFHRAISAHLTTFHDEADLADAAAGRSDLADALAPFGHVIWHLPAPMHAPLARFVGAVLSAAPSTVLAGVTGDPQADAPVRRVCQRAGLHWPEDASASVEVPTADRITSVTDADEEVRSVVRQVVRLAEDGVRLDRIGIFHPTPDPYVNLLEQQLQAAGVPSNGPSRRRLSDSAAGRTLLGALALPSLRWRRDRVMALVAGAPVLGPDGPARPTGWESVSRQAGVVQDLSDWRRKLGSRRAGLTARLADLAQADDAPEWMAERVQRDLTDLDALEHFVEGLAASVATVQDASGWEARSRAAVELLHRLLGAGTHPGWPEAEQDALERVEDALIRLAALEELEPDPSHEVFLRALQAELDVTLGRRGRFGEGVMYGPLSAAAGHDLDAVFLLGCAEGLCPTPRRDDSMLPDDARRLTDGELELRRDALHEQHRWFLAALASAPAGARVLTFPRGDLRSGRESLPSRWLLDTASALTRKRVHSTDFGAVDHPSIQVVASHVGALRTSPVHASLLERDLVALDRHVASGGAALDHPVIEPVLRGVHAQLERRSPRFTEWDGNLAGQPIPSTAERPQSPTRLETWAKCGMRYFLGQVLGLSDRDDPERVLELSPLDRGSGVHEALEDFLAEVIEQGAPSPDEPWSEGHRARLQEIAQEKLADYERRGRTGRPVNWQLTKGDVLALLDGFLSSDDEHRATTRSVPERVELPFGLDGEEPVTIALADGRQLRFRGKADRVDRTQDGRVHVSDYKTSRGGAYGGLEDDPVLAGTTLQLGLYAEAARQLLGADAVDARYWLINAEAAYRRLGYEWTDERRDRFVSVLTAIVDGIESGVFPAVPGEWNYFMGAHDNCRYCEFDHVCVRDRGEHAEVKVAAPELAVRAALTPEEPA